jgi:hypothetical protein
MCTHQLMVSADTKDSYDEELEHALDYLAIQSFKLTISNDSLQVMGPKW